MKSTDDFYGEMHKVIFQGEKVTPVLIQRSPVLRQQTIRKIWNKIFKEKQEDNMEGKKFKWDITQKQIGEIIKEMVAYCTRNGVAINDGYDYGIQTFCIKNDMEPVCENIEAIEVAMEGRLKIVYHDDEGRRFIGLTHGTYRMVFLGDKPICARQLFDNVPGDAYAFTKSTFGGFVYSLGTDELEVLKKEIERQERGD